VSGGSPKIIILLTKIKNDKLTRTKTTAGQDNCTSIILIKGCGYRVPNETIVEFLAIHGIVVSDVIEQLIVDGSNPSAGY
jgi:hypothetical protein